jgi:hypothetical protein
LPVTGEYNYARQARHQQVDGRSYSGAGDPSRGRIVGGDRGGDKPARRFWRAGAGPSKGRFAAGRAAGLSDRQTKTALRVANIPEAEFEEAIESADPPTVTELAKRGTRSKPLVDLGQRTPEQFQAATGLIGAVERLQRYADKEADLEMAIRGLNARERRELIASTVPADRGGDLLRWPIVGHRQRADLPSAATCAARG